MAGVCLYIVQSNFNPVANPPAAALPFTFFATLSTPLAPSTTLLAVLAAFVTLFKSCALAAVKENNSATIIALVLICFMFLMSLKVSTFLITGQT
ncbi:hypothetical protein D3C86_1484610 [compost metagenome]